MQFYAVQRDYKTKHLKVRANEQEELADKFKQDAERYRSGKEVVGFDSGWNTEDHELFKIDGFELPKDLQRCVRSADGCEDMTASEFDEGNIKAMFGASVNQAGDVETVIFKNIDKSMIVNRNRINLRYDLRYDQETITRTDAPGLAVPDSVAAVYMGGTLYFSSRRTAGQVLDLTVTFETASNADVQDFLNSGPLLFESVDDVQEIADDWSRRRIKMISSNPVWQEVDVSDIRGWAKECGVEVKVVTDAEGRQLIELPSDRAGLKNLLRVLNEDFFEAPFSKQKFLSNSKRRAV